MKKRRFETSVSVFFKLHSPIAKIVEIREDCPHDLVTHETNLLLPFPSAVSAKIYYASLCVRNEVGRTIILKPDKGNPKGFEIEPDSTLEVTLMSMSTDGAPIKPVYFIGEDKETLTHLRINDFDKAFPVTPRDGRKPCKTLIVTVSRKCIFALMAPSFFNPCCIRYTINKIKLFYVSFLSFCLQHPSYVTRKCGHYARWRTDTLSETIPSPSPTGL